MRLPLPLLILFLLQTVTGCSPAVTPKPTAAVLEQYESAVSRLRELPFTRPIQTGTRSRPEVQAYVESRIAEEYGPGELAFEGEALMLLGLIPPQYPYRKCLISFLRDQVSGYYDARAKTLYFADGTAPSETEGVLAHELTHALQDQHFDLDRLIKRNRSNDDGTAAINALIEGDATYVMIERLSHSKREGTTAEPAPESKSTCDLPPALYQSFLFPYLYGVRFVQELRAAEGWKAVNQAYTELPQSTEQILHPEKYILKNDAPVEVARGFLEGRLPVDWPILNDNVLGEWGWQLVFSEAVGAGWGGDRYWLLEKPDGSKALLSVSIWDTERDAVEVEAGWGRKFPPPTSSVVRQGTRVVASVGIERVVLETVSTK